MTETAGVVVQLRANVAELEKGMQRAQRAIDRAASQIERRATRFSNRFEREITNSARESAAVFEQAFAAEKSFGQLEQSLNPAIAALRRYEAAQETVKRAVDAGRVSQERAAGVLALAQAEYQRSTAAINNVAGGLQQGSARYSQFGNVVQQAGFQVGDFAVQVASGGGVLRPFIQQGTQLISMFGPWGAVIGAAGAVVGALAVAFLDAGGEAESFEDALDAVNAKARDVESLNALTSSLDDLREAYGEITKEIIAFLQAEKELEMRRLLSETQALVGEVEKLSRAYDSMGDNVPSEFSGALDGIAGVTDSLVARINEAVDGAIAMGEAVDAGSFVSAANEAAKIRDRLEEARDEAGNLPPEAQELYDKLVEVERTMRRAAVQTREVKTETAGAAEEASALEGNLSGAVGQARNLARALSSASNALSSAQDKLARAKIGLEFRGDPVGEARRLAELEAQQAIREAQGSISNEDFESGRASVIIQEVREKANATVAALTEAAKLEEEIARLNKADKGADKGVDKERRERERAAEAVQKEITAISGKIAKLGEERQLLQQRASLQSAGLSPESIARAEAVLTAELSRQNIVQELLNKAKQEGVSLTPVQIAEIEVQARATKDLTLANYDLEASIKAQADSAADAAKRQEDLAKAVADTGSRFISAIERADSFADALRNIALAAADLAIQGLGGQGPFGALLGNVLPSLFGVGSASFTGPGQSIRSLGFAKGGAFSGGNVIPFARGGIVSRPTIFPMARGAGLMGETGPEAILPLRRGADGRLGVAGGGGGTVVNVYAPPGSDVREERQQSGNMEHVNLYIEQAAARGMGRPGSPLQRAMHTQYGARPALRRE